MTDAPSTDLGFILIVVLLIALLLALMALTFSGSVRTLLRITGNSAASAEAEAAADAGFAVALLDLAGAKAIGPDAQRRFKVDGTPSACALENGALAVIAIRDEAGRVSLNAADEKLLTALFVGLGAGLAEARSYADRVIDFRDADDVRRESGAEATDYAEAGLPPPRNGRFEMASEITRVLGLPKPIAAKAVRHVTAHSGQNGIDPSVAGPALKRVLAEAAWQGASGASTRIRMGAGFDDAVPVAFVAKSQGLTYAVRAEGRSPAGAVFVREGTVELSASPPGAYLLKEWHRGESPIEGLVLSTDAPLPPC